MNESKQEAQFLVSLADIFIKIFQIVFAMMVVGVVVKDRFDPRMFSVGIIISSFCLTTSILLYYNAYIKGDER